MSRWIEHFDSHPFQSVWTSLKKSLEETVVDDKTVMTSVKEVARLKKVVSYLDGIINGIDPELVPAATWDSFHSQANACLSQVTTYNNNKAIAHITQANVHVDNLLTYVRPYMILDGKISKALQQSLKNYAKTIDEYGKSFVKSTSGLIDDIRNYKEQGNELFEEIESTNKSIVDYSAILFGSDDEGGIKKKIEELFDKISEYHEKTNEFYNETFIGDEEEVSTKKSILESKEFIEEEKDKIENLMNSIVSEIKEINNFHIKIFGTKTDDDEEVNGGMSGDLDELITKMETFKKEQKIKYKALNEQIEQLLPGATSAGLASAYKHMKDTFDNPIKYAGYVRRQLSCPVRRQLS